MWDDAWMVIYMLKLLHSCFAIAMNFWFSCPCVKYVCVCVCVCVSQREIELKSGIVTWINKHKSEWLLYCLSIHPFICNYDFYVIIPDFTLKNQWDKSYLALLVSKNKLRIPGYHNGMYSFMPSNRKDKSIRKNK